MGIFTRSSSAPPSESRAFGIRTWGDLVSALTSSAPRTLTLSEALYNAAVWSCLDLLAGSMADTPLDAVRVIDKARLPVEPAPPVIESPSGVVDADVWRYQLAVSLLSDGNAFGTIVDVDPATQLPTQIELIDPAQVTNRRVVAGVPTVAIAGQDRKLFPHGDVWHCPGKMVLAGSPFGVSTLHYASGSARVSIAAQRFVSEFFDGGGHPTSMLKVKVPDLKPDEAQAIKTAYRRAITSGSGDPLVLGEDIDYSAIQSDPGKVGFADVVRFQVEEICRFFRVPPTMVYGAVSGQSVTYTNATQSDLAYLKHSLNGWLRRAENALTTVLPNGMRARFNRNAVLEMDPEARWKIHDLRLKNKTTSVNEVRALEDEAPFDDPMFDQPGVPAGEAVSSGADEARSVAELIQKIYLGVGTVLTTEEARKIANAAGAGLPIPGPDLSTEKP